MDRRARRAPSVAGLVALVRARRDAGGGRASSRGSADAAARRAPPRSASARTGERRRTRSSLAAALLVAVGLRLLYLGFPLGTDEGGVAFIAKAWGSGHGSLYGAYWLDRPPLLVALYKLAVPGGPTGIRVLGALAALALVAVTTVVTRAVAGERAARIAAVLSAGLASSIALAAVFTPAELLAAVPAAGSVGCLVAAHRRGQARWLVGAGLLAVDRGADQAVVPRRGLRRRGLPDREQRRDRRLRLRWAARLRGRRADPAGGRRASGWPSAHVSPGSLVYALFGFRIHALHALAASNLPLHVRLQSLSSPAPASGLFVVLVVALRGLWTLRGDRVLAVTLAALARRPAPSACSAAAATGRTT